MINDPQSIRFVNEVVRPLAEAARAFRVRVDSAQTQWFSGLNATFPNTSEAVDDGREAEGVSRLTGADVNSLMGVLIAMNNAGNSEIISKPTVQQLQVG